MALSRPEESKQTVSKYYEKTLSTYEAYIGHEEATFLAEKIESDIEKFKANKFDENIIYKLLTTLAYIHEKIVFEETIKKLNILRCAVMESLTPLLSGEVTLHKTQEFISNIMTKTNFINNINTQLDDALDNGLFEMLDDELSSSLTTSKQTEPLMAEELEAELSKLIEEKINSLKSECITFYKVTQFISFDSARKQGMSVMDSLNAIKDSDSTQPLDMTYESLMDRVYGDWKKNKSKEEIGLIDYPLLKARLLLFVGLEEYITYLPKSCVAVSKMSQAFSEETTHTPIDQEKQKDILVETSPLPKKEEEEKEDKAEESHSTETNPPSKLFLFGATDFFKTFLPSSLFGGSTPSNLLTDSKPEETKKTLGIW